MKRVAILGATGYVGKSLAFEFLEEEEVELFLFSRSMEKLEDSFKSIKLLDRKRHFLYKITEFNDFNYDAVINCAGTSDSMIIQKDPQSFLMGVEQTDDMVIDHIKKNIQTFYINISSGAVSLPNIADASLLDLPLILKSEKLTAQQYYGYSKRVIEAKHRALTTLTIIDIRLFSFFSQFVDVSSRFLMSEIVCSLREGKVFETNDDDIVRDYVCPKDFKSLILLLLSKGHTNDAFDVGSLAPLSKFHLLNILHEKYGLVYKVRRTEVAKVSLSSSIYSGHLKKAKKLGYSPEFDSISGILYEMDKISF